MLYYQVSRILLTCLKINYIPLLMSSSWFVYLLRCADNSLYAGITTDIERRVKEHNDDNKRAAKYTRARRPVALAYMEKAEDKKCAAQREYRLRKLNKPAKEALVSQYQEQNNKKTKS